MSLLKNTTLPRIFLREKTTLEEECVRKCRSRHIVSKLYNILSKAKTSEVLELTYFDKWEGDLNTKLREIDRKKILKLTHGSSISTKFQENSFKLLTR